MIQNQFKKTLLLGCFVFMVFQLKAQANTELMQLFKRRTHTFEQTTLPYRIFIPDNYNSSQSYPLILCLHGAGERGNDNERHIWKHDLALSWAKPEVQKSNPCFVVAPQCPKKLKWNYVDWHKGTFSIDTVEPGNELLTVVNLLDSLLKEFNIDIKRQYVTGLSMGGYGTWDIITRYPERFAAAVPMSGAGDFSKVASLKNVPIWVFHNTHDKIVPVSGSRDMVQAMNKAGLSVLETINISDKSLNKSIKKGVKYLYTESPTGNHGPWEPWYGNAMLHKWVFLQTK